MESGACIILTSVASRTDAMIMAKKLVEEGLAACVQISAQGDSLYRWQGSIQQEHEHILNIKTTRSNRQAVIKWLQKHHPYDIPEIISLDAEASSTYLQWMHASTCNGSLTQ
jgi:periplasmic divalent cation tolerance protein